jgi:hypothetical protein
MPDHACDCEPAPWHGAARQKPAAVEIGIGRDRLARDLVEGEVLRREPQRRGNDDAVRDPFRVRDGPVHRLHATKAAADHGGPAPDAEPVGEPRLRLDPVGHPERRKIRPPDLPARGIGRSGPRAAGTATGIVERDDEE